MKKITDKMRLDWFERTEGEKPYPLVDGGWWWSQSSDPKPTLRQAIDAAIKAEKRKP